MCVVCFYGASLGIRVRNDSEFVPENAVFAVTPIDDGTLAKLVVR